MRSRGGRAWEEVKDSEKEKQEFSGQTFGCAVMRKNMTQKERERKRQKREDTDKRKKEQTVKEQKT